MYFYNLIKEMLVEQNIDLFVDMDGVIASYDFGKPLDFKKKRPLYSNIKILEEVSKLDGLNLYILSVCRKNYQIEEKNEWLDKYAPFFKEENRIILSKENTPDVTSPLLKLNFLKEFKSNNKVVLVDDDNNILSIISKSLKNVVLLQDSELID